MVPANHSPMLNSPKAYLWLCLTACLFTLLAAPPAKAEVAAEKREIISKWLQLAARVPSVQGDFDQIRRLKNVNKPLIRAGKIWLEKPDHFRWQIGEPPTMLALRGKDGKLIVLDAREKKARVWTKEALMQSEQQGIAMIGEGFGSSLAEFEKRFEIEDVEPVSGQPDVWKFSLVLRDRQAVLFVKNVFLTVSVADGSLRSFLIQMRDGSTMETVMKSYRLGESLKPDTFKVDTEGYQIEEMKAKS